MPRRSDTVGSLQYPSPHHPLHVIRLTLPLPPVVNRYWRSVVVGRVVRVLLSAAARRYHKVVARYLADMDPIDYPVMLGVTVYIDRRGTDVDAHIKATLDTLEKAGLIANDNLVCALGVTRFYDRHNPRVELEIVRVTDPALIDAIAPSKLAA